MRRAFVALAFLAALSGRGDAAAPPGPASVPIARPDEPGERLIFEGRVLDYGGRPLARAAVVAYHADRGGLYNPPASPTRVPRLRAVAVTDEAGRFRFVSVRPGAYPDGTQPAHVHVAVTAPAHHTRHMEFWFDDDPLLTPARRAAAARQGDTIIVAPARGADGAWSFSHDLRLEGN